MPRLYIVILALLRLVRSITVGFPSNLVVEFARIPCAEGILANSTTINGTLIDRTILTGCLLTDAGSAGSGLR